MLTHSRRLFVTCFIGFIGCAVVAFAAQKPEDAAQAAAESWLKLVDRGDYSASWARAAKGLKGAVSKAEWSEMVGGVRTPLGKLVSRKVKSRRYTEKAPTTTRVVGGRVYTWGGPGRYVVIQYDTAFADKASAVETLIVMSGPEGAWRVSGYAVR